MWLLPESSLDETRDSRFEWSVGERVESHQKEGERTNPAPEQRFVAATANQNHTGNRDERGDPEEIRERPGYVRREPFCEVWRLLLNSQPERSIFAAQQVIEKT